MRAAISLPFIVALSALASCSQEISKPSTGAPPVHCGRGCRIDCREISNVTYAGAFARAESVRFEFQTREDRHEYVVTSRAIFAQFAPSEPADILKCIAKICRAAEMGDARIIDLFRRRDPIFVAHRVESTDHGPDRSRPFNTSLLGARPAPPREHGIVSVCSAFAA
jgi:hypothetical protein